MEVCGTLHSLGTRVTAETKDRLIAAALRSGRTMTAEAAWILEQSFVAEESGGQAE